MTISIDDFKELDLQIGTIQTVEEHPNADKLLLLQVDVGEIDNRQLVAGLKEDYEASALEGDQVVVLTNLEEAEIRGEKSQGMVLAADAERHIALLNPDKPVPNGTTVR